MKFSASIIAFFLLSATALAADDSRYNSCSSLVDSDPVTAITHADKWLAEIDNAAARHCRSLALYKLGRFEEAAVELEKTAAYDTVGSETKVTALKQAAQSWQNAKKTENAAKAYGSAANVAVESNDTKEATALLMEKAKIEKAASLDFEAIQTLDYVIEIAPGNTEAMMLRSDVFEKMGKAELAKRDKMKALGIPEKKVAATKTVMTQKIKPSKKNSKKKKPVKKKPTKPAKKKT